MKKARGATMYRPRIWIMLLGLFILQGYALGQYSGGGGTAEDPWIIATPGDIASLAASPEHWADAFIQGADIDMAQEAPVSSIGTFDEPFTGSYDGRGFIIKNLLVLGVPQSQPGGDGLFGVIRGNNGTVTIQNVSLVNPTVIGASPDTGGLIGRIEQGTVQGCRLEGGCISGAETVGGLIGHVLDGAAVYRCCATTVVLGTENIGGLIGLSTGTVEDCYCKGNTVAQWGVPSPDTSYPALGGLVGYNFTGRIASCYADCETLLWPANETMPMDIGGLVGRWVLDQNSILFGPANYSCQETLGLPSGGHNAIGSPASDDLKGWSNLIAVSVSRLALQLKSTFRNWDFEYVWTFAEGTSPELQ